MLIIAIILVLLWALGFSASYTLGGLLHLLLALAIVIVLVPVIRRGRLT